MPKDEKDLQSPTNRAIRSNASDLRFPRANHLKGRTAIRQTIVKGVRYRGKWLGVSAIKGETSRFGISISRKFGKAVRRNRVKRIIREFLRNNKALWPVNRWIMIRLFSDPADETVITEELRALLSKVK